MLNNKDIDNSPAADFIRDACDKFLRTMPSISEDMGKVIEEEKKRMLVKMLMVFFKSLSNQKT